MRGRRPLAITGLPLERLRAPSRDELFAALDGGAVPIGPEQSWHSAGARVRIPDPDVGAVAMHAVSVGRGPHLLLIHGFVQASWCWRDVLAPLSAHYTVHAVCLPGFGWSAKPIAAGYRMRDQAQRLLTWMDVMGIDRAHICGVSMGGAIAAELALHAPARVGRLVLVNPAGAGSYPMAWLAAVQRESFAPLLRLPGVPFGLKLGLRWAAYAKLPVDAHYMAHFLAPLRLPGATEAALAVARSYNADVKDLDPRLAAVQAPTLIVRGGRDRIIPAAVVERVAARLPQAQRVHFEDAGHCPMEEEPERFATDVLAFLAAER